MTTVISLLCSQHCYNVDIKYCLVVVCLHCCFKKNTVKLNSYKHAYSEFLDIL